MNCIHTGRDLLDQHLLIVAKAEAKGVPAIAELANEMWSWHEVVIDALNDILAAARES